jgi:alpha/beta hydrolase fold
MPIRRNLLLIFALFILYALSGCDSLPSTSMETGNQKTTEYAQINRGIPVVVFENGLGASMDSWSNVFPEIGKNVTVFAYNRAGYGNSSKATAPRDGATVVEELRALLHSRGLRPPYVLVGHSLGGLYVQLFARKYPDDVVGLVLVDSSHPSQFEGPGAVENWSILAKFMKLFLNTSQENELLAANETGHQILRSPTLSTKPVIILNAKLNSNSENARFLNEKKADLSRLYPNAQQIWVDSGHFIQNDKPEVVIGAIKDIAKLQAQR